MPRALFGRRGLGVGYDVTLDGIARPLAAPGKEDGGKGVFRAKLELVLSIKERGCRGCLVPLPRPGLTGLCLESKIWPLLLGGSPGVFAGKPAGPGDAAYLQYHHHITLGRLYVEVKDCII